jgi:hypothetical protein
MDRLSFGGKGIFGCAGAAECGRKLGILRSHLRDGGERIRGLDRRSDRASALQFQSAGLEIRPFRPAVLYDIAVFHAADPNLSTLARNFLDAFDAHMRNFLVDGD